MSQGWGHPSERALAVLGWGLWWQQKERRRGRKREKGRESETDGGTGENKVSTLNNEVVVSNQGC